MFYLQISLSLICKYFLFFFIFYLYYRLSVDNDMQIVCEYQWIIIFQPGQGFKLMIFQYK